MYDYYIWNHVYQKEDILPILCHKTCFVLADGYKSRWLESKHKSDYGQWKHSAGKFYGDAELDKGEGFIFVHLYFVLHLLDPVANIFTLKGRVI